MAYLISGQGLAGTLLAHFLLESGADVKIFDAGHNDASSKVAAGVMNPFTGRYFVKSWLYDELYPFAIKTYSEIGAMLGKSFYHNTPVLRFFHDIKSENDWLMRAPDLEGEYTMPADMTPYHEVFDHITAAVTFTHSGRCDIGSLTAAYQQHFRDLGILIDAPTDPEQLNAQSGDTVIFCEGSWGRENPFWSFAALGGVKGEVFIVRIPDYPFKTNIVKHEFHIVPLGYDDLYWIGSNYDNHYTDRLPGTAMRENLEAALKRWFKLNWEIVDHKAAVRPVSRDRRPVIGQHPEIPNFYLFNGLGAKGTTLAPYFAHQLAMHLLHGRDMMHEVRVR